LSLDAKTRAKIARNIYLLEQYGLHLGGRYIKNIDGKLFELRIKDFKGIYRILYFAHTGKQFVLLHGFIKKSQKTPREDIELAQKRMMEVING